MLSIGAMKGGQVEYYLRLAQEDYYLEGGEPPGRWKGRGAKALGLKGVVEAEELRRCFTGYSPEGKPLVKNAGNENRQPGWDLTFSPPKSLSVAWSQAEKSEQEIYQACHDRAVDAALSFLEENFAFSRIGKGGLEEVKASLVVATFEHSTSRALDVQLHTHCLVMNLGIDAEGDCRTILSKPFYQAKMLTGAYYRSVLARELRKQLGLTAYRPLDKNGRARSWFEIEGVSKNVMDHFSKRRKEILKELGSKGMESASAAAFATLSTRKVKDVVPARAELHERWKKEGGELDYKSPELHAVTLHDAATSHKLYREALSEAVAEITFSENYFTPELLKQRTLEEGVLHGLKAEEVVEAVDIDLREIDSFVSLGVRSGEELWTTKEVLAVEKEFLDAAREVQQRKFKAVESKHVEKALLKERGQGGSTYQLDAEQKQAVRYITKGSESLKVVTGFAGTGKTDLLIAAREALEEGGYNVIGTALANAASKGLEEKTGIKSENVRVRELQLHSGFTHAVKHHAKQLARAAVGMKTYKYQPLKIDSKTVLVIDEAGMVGTRDFALLSKAVAEQGGTIVAVGDEFQLPSVERGGCLGTLTKVVDGVHLSEIRRQESEADRKAVKDLVAGNAEEALTHYAKLGQFTVSKDAQQTESQLISDWVRAGGCSLPEEHKIFAATHAQVDRMNELAQWERAKVGEVDAEKSVEHDGRRFMVGDEVRFSTTERKLGITKAETGVVIECKDGLTGKYLVVRTAEAEPLTKRAADAAVHHAKQLINEALGKKTEKLPPRRDVVLVPLKTLNFLAPTYEGLRLNYSQTVHASQGQSIKNVYIHLGGKMTDRELSYVQGSRHQETLRLYAEDKEAGKSLTELAKTYQVSNDNPVETDLPDYSSLVKKMSLSRAKQLATQVASDNGRREVSLGIGR